MADTRLRLPELLDERHLIVAGRPDYREDADRLFSSWSPHGDARPSQSIWRQRSGIIPRVSARFAIFSKVSSGWGDKHWENKCGAPTSDWVFLHDPSKIRNHFCSRLRHVSFSSTPRAADFRSTVECRNGSMCQ